MAPARLSSRATFIYRLVYPDLVDEVFNEGDAFLVRNKDQEDRISLSDIAAVRYRLLFVPNKSHVVVEKTKHLRNRDRFCIAGLYSVREVRPYQRTV